jgi:apolipoprotein D and lipocalin family protein
MKSTAARTAVIVFVVAFAGGATAGAPPPARPVTTAVYSGRWYEIARTPNVRQQGCQRDTTDFSGLAAGAFEVVEICHADAPAGVSRTLRTNARIVPGSGNAGFAMSFLGGLIHQQYWVLDHADDSSWAIMTTPGGHYIWLMARRPVMDAPARAAALKRIVSLGYNPARLILQPAP